MSVNHLRRLFFLSVLAASGLLSLQLFWIQKNWKDTSNILSRQLNYNFQKAVEEEHKYRIDSFYRSIYQVIYDKRYHFYSYRFTDLGLSITMYNSVNPGDSVRTRLAILHDPTAFQNKSGDEVMEIVKQEVWSEISANILNDYVHNIYTKLYDSIYWNKYNQLKLDTVYLGHAFTRLLVRDNIPEKASLRIIDKRNYKTSYSFSSANRNTNTFRTDPLPIHFNSVKDPSSKYVAYAYLDNFSVLILKRTWISWLSTLLLIALTLYCLYRMYRTIVTQKQVEEVKNDFISNMTHELKTPLATIRAAIDSLQYFDGLKNKEKTDRYLDISRKQLGQLDHIITEVLNTSIYSRKMIQLEIVPIPFREMIESIISSFQVRKEKTFSYTVSCDPDIIIFVDKVHFTNAITNIFDNSFKYAQGNLRLIICCKKIDGYTWITIEDNGPGIKQEYLHHIFENLYRVPSGNIHNVKGFGIGLFYVKTITDLHGGSVSAESKHPGGTTIKIKLPPNPK